jgi:H+/Cl- antiporter ClcA
MFMGRGAKWLNTLYPILIAGVATYILYKLDFTFKVKNFDKVLDGAITFSSIVVGFLGALLGILVSIKDSNIVKAIFVTNEKYTIKYYFNETFIVGLLVVISSCVMHVLREYNTVWTDIFFYSWIILFSWFLPSTYRIINVLMTVFFKSNNTSAETRPDSNRIDDDARREEMRRNLSR